MTLNSLLRLGAVSLVAAVFPGAGLAQYPERPVHMVVPYPPGGGTDNIARLLADRLAQQMGRPFVVDNRPGANGNIGADAVARAPADGYTLLLAGMGPLAVNPGLYKRMPYDPAKAFAPIAVVSSAPLVLVAGPSAPAGDLRQLVRIMRERPDSLTIANAGEGSPHHICAGLFVKAAGVSVIHVPYKGAAPAVTDLLGGSVQALCENVGTISPYLKERGIREGQFRMVDAHVAAFSLIGMCNWSAWWYKPSGRLSIAEVADLMAEMGVNALLRDEARRSRSPADARESLRLVREDLDYLEKIIDRASNAT